jgi:hypothetical protein
VDPDNLPVGLFLVSTQISYQNFFAPGFLHYFVVEGCSELCGPWDPYPVRFLNEFHPRFSLACGVDFSLPPVNDHFVLWIDLREKGTLGFSSCLLHPYDLQGTCWKFLPLGAPLTLGILHSYHLDLILVVLVLNSSSVSIHPFLVCRMASIIASVRSMDISNVSYFMGFPWLQAYSGNHGSPVKVYLLVLFHCFWDVCSWEACCCPYANPWPCMLYANHLSPHICAWVRCTHTCPRATFFFFVLFHLLIILSTLPRATSVLLSIDRTVTKIFIVTHV